MRICLVPRIAMWGGIETICRDGPKEESLATSSGRIGLFPPFLMGKPIGMKCRGNLQSSLVGLDHVETTFDQRLRLSDKSSLDRPEFRRD